jgi:hypothetical protein
MSSVAVTEHTDVEVSVVVVEDTVVVSVGMHWQTCDFATGAAARRTAMIFLAAMAGSSQSLPRVSGPTPKNKLKPNVHDWRRQQKAEVLIST